MNTKTLIAAAVLVALSTGAYAFGLPDIVTLPAATQLIVNDGAARTFESAVSHALSVFGR